MRSSTKRQLVSIQYLRALAALAVVFHHARGAKPWLYDPLSTFGAGQAGVDIFFVISGYIMFSAARAETVGEFIRRRFVRIVPLYWCATILQYGGLLHTPPTSQQDLIGHLWRSLLFLPHWNPIRPGDISPVLVAGWTLNYEMFFYILFGIGLFIKRPMLTASFALPVLVIAGLVWRIKDPVWSTYTSPLLLEFLAGMLISRFQDLLVHPAARWLLPIAGTALVLGGFTEGPRILWFGVPAAAAVMGALSLERSGRLPQLPWLARLGDASYSIYLFQILGLGLAVRLVPKLPISGPPQLAAMIFIAIGASAVLGFLIHRFLERPLTRRLARRRGPAAADTLAAP